MTGTPDLFCVRLVLNDAFQVRANGRESFEFSGGRVNQNAGLVSEFENLSRIDWNFTEFCCDH